MPAVVVTVDATGISPETYQSLTREVGAASTVPSGGILRVAGPIAGGWRVLSVWESREAWEAFRNERLMPAMQKAGAQPVRVEVWPVAEVQRAS